MTVDGTLIMPLRADGRDGVSVAGPVLGSLERADCTRASSRCIWAVRLRMWLSELGGGTLWEGARLVLDDEVRWPGDRVVLDIFAFRLEREVDVDPVKFLGFGVIVFSAEGANRPFRCRAGVLVPGSLEKGAEASDIGGDGGS